MLKVRQMWTLGVNMKGWLVPVSLWLVHWARRTGRYNRFLSCLGCSHQPSTKYYLPHSTLFQYISPYRPATWAGSRAGSPVYVSLLSPINLSSLLALQDYLQPAVVTSVHSSGPDWPSLVTAQKIIWQKHILHIGFNEYSAMA